MLSKSDPFRFFAKNLGIVGGGAPRCRIARHSWCALRQLLGSVFTLNRDVSIEVRFSSTMHDQVCGGI
jgi:hypothetical protein